MVHRSGRLRRFPSERQMWHRVMTTVSIYSDWLRECLIGDVSPNPCRDHDDIACSEVSRFDYAETSDIRAHDPAITAFFLARYDLRRVMWSSHASHLRRLNLPRRRVPWEFRKCWELGHDCLPIPVRIEKSPLCRLGLCERICPGPKLLLEYTSLSPGPGALSC